MNQDNKTQLPSGLLVSWYGDDFTGAAAVMEVLTFSGLPSVLFLDIPTKEQLKKFANMRGIGIAGTARSRSPEWMGHHLPKVFKFLGGLEAPICHYKICSTLDSSPQTGSIGKAIDIASKTFQSPWIPLVVAAPALRRFQAFGNLFAAASKKVFRLDKHPVMSRHPITPMAEANVVAHLEKQTDTKIGLVDMEALQTQVATFQSLSTQIKQGAQIMCLDCVDVPTLGTVGQLIWQQNHLPLFCVGSQGIEYALVQHWQNSAALPKPEIVKKAPPCEQIVVISGSVSTTTSEQISWSIDHGFDGIFFDPMSALIDDAALDNTIEMTVQIAVSQIQNGHSPIIYTAKGPDDPAVTPYLETLAKPEIDAAQVNERLGEALGKILTRTLNKTGLQRAIIAGGDTSGHATKMLEIFALTALAPTIPGAALFLAHSDNPKFQNLELALKGGQMGTHDYFNWIKDGGGLRKQTGKLT